MERYWADVSFLIEDSGLLVTGIDVMLAAFVFRSYTSFSELWRFHRRYVDDKTGHKFTFYMYTYEEMIRSLYEAVQEDPLVKYLTKNGLATLKLDYQTGDYRNAASISSISDPAWHLAVRYEWPWLATGFSQMWLRMVMKCLDDLKVEVPKKWNRENVTNLIQTCSMINGMIVGIYQTQGQHFVTHHTDVLFGTWDKGK